MCVETSLVTMLNIENYQLDPDILGNPLFRTQMKCMLWYGYIIGTNQRYPYWHMARCWFFTLSTVGCCILGFMKVSHGFDNLDVGAASVATSFLYLTSSVTVVKACLERARVVRLIRYVHDDLKSLLANADAVEQALFESTLRYLRWVVIMLWGACLFAGVIAYTDCFWRTVFMPETVFNMPQVLNGTAQPILMFKLFPFGEVYDNFVIGYLGALLGFYLGITSIPIWHSFIACLMKYVTLKLEIISERMRKMDISKVAQHIDGNLENLSDEELNYWRLKLCKFCATEQIEIRWFIAELEALIGLPVFLDFILFSVLICFLLYALTTGDSSPIDSLFICIYLYVMAAILWVYHFHATLILLSNDDLRYAIYSCDWYNYPLPVQKTIRLLMMGSATPLVITAIFVELNLKTFIDVVRGAYSYFSILRNTMDD